jgi:hypothetical protein
VTASNNSGAAACYIVVTAGHVSRNMGTTALKPKHLRAVSYAVPPCKNEDAELAGSTSEHGGVSDALTTPHLLAISPDGHSPTAGVVADKGSVRNKSAIPPFASTNRFRTHTYQRGPAPKIKVCDAWRHLRCF